MEYFCCSRLLAKNYKKKKELHQDGTQHRHTDHRQIHRLEFALRITTHHHQQAGHDGQHHHHDDGDDTPGEGLHGEGGGLLVHVVHQDVLHLQLLLANHGLKLVLALEQGQHLNLSGGERVSEV